MSRMTPHRTLIIAEAGVNHNGDLRMALDLIDKAAAAGADVVKFQTFRADRLATRAAPKAAYQLAQTGSAESQLDMLRRLELGPEAHAALIRHCAARGIAFLSTPFDTDSLRLLVETHALPRIKLGSGELTNAPFLLEIGRAGVDVILSTGMATLAEVEQALGVLGFAMRGGDTPPSRAGFASALWDDTIWDLLRARVTLLHCTTDYPSRAEDANLRAMDTMARAFGLPVGYSDHSEGNALCLAAVALGACVIEKHFTLDRGLPGPDHAASIEPDALGQLVRDIRRVEAALGSGVKQPRPDEQKNRAIVRKSLVAARDLPAGHVLEAEDIALMRPGTGHPPISFWDRVGTRLTRAHSAGEALE